MKRRIFLKSSGLGILALTTRGWAEDKASSEKPNILIIISDQQFGDGMSCVLGREYFHTPNMDSLADNGMRFTRAYAPNPLCMPMRTSMITGLYPHQTGVQSNERNVKNTATSATMGEIFQKAGYETAHFGKWHVVLNGKHGFDTFKRAGSLDPEPAVEFIRKKHDRPFLAVASFLSPHEICQWARKERLPGGKIGTLPPVDKRPPVRKNSGPPENETDIMAHMRKSYQSWSIGGRLAFPVGNYTEDDWRRHIWGYYRLIERMDRFVGEVMNALRDSGQAENTVVVFLSDHGDCHGAHLWNQKTVFYDESTRVPFIISRKGTTPKGTSDVLLNTGVDIIPTICDFAGIKIPADLPGKSMKNPALGKKPDWKREYIVSQNHMVQCAEVDGKHFKPHGRMVQSKSYKYCLYSEGQRRESLVDMEKDPGEMVNQAGNPDFKKTLNQHRAFLKEFAEKHKDAKALEMLQYVKASDRIRTCNLRFRRKYSKTAIRTYRYCCYEDSPNLESGGMRKNAANYDTSASPRQAQSGGRGSRQIVASRP
jgi:arylsulfatase A-like enzyme